MAEALPAAPIGRCLVLLAAASGVSDVMAYLQLGHVFASAMTGAAALFGIALTRGHWLELGRAGMALGGFSLGGLSAALLLRPDERGAAKMRELRAMFMLEAIVLAGFVLVWSLTPKPVPRFMDFPLIGLLAFAMGAQNVAALQMDVPGINTVVINNTIAKIVVGVTRRIERVYLSPRRERMFHRQIAVLAGYLGGAMLGAGIALADPVATGWPPFFAVIGVLVVLHRADRTGRR